MKTSIMKLFAALLLTASMAGCASFGDPQQLHDLTYDPATYPVA